MTLAEVRDFCPEKTNGDLEAVCDELKKFDIEVVKRPGVQAPKAKEGGGPEQEGQEGIDDLVNVYLREMARSPLLSAAEEVAIAKRIEAAEEAFRCVIYRFGFIAK